MKTFIELYEFLRIQDKHFSFIKWLEDSWSGKDKQESVLRLFAKLNLIEKIEKYKACDGNFNTGSYEIILTNKQIFYNKLDSEIYLKDNGDSSDLTLIKSKTILAFSSKNLSTYNWKSLDLELIINKFDEFNNLTLELGLCVNNWFNKSLFDQCKKTTKNTKSYKSVMSKLKYIIDWNDLSKAYDKFKDTYSNVSINDLIKTDRNNNEVVYYPHQLYSIDRTIEYLKDNTCILWGHVPRSGKSYMISGLIEKLNYQTGNYLIITTAPNETIIQYLNILYENNNLSRYIKWYYTNLILI